MAITMSQSVHLGEISYMDKTNRYSGTVIHT